jgi:hypothetical protein
MNPRHHFKHTAALLAAALATTACASDEAPANQLSGVRILATSSDKPFAKPGETVNVEVLAVDARSTKISPMQTYFFPKLCINPIRDEAAKCLAELAKDYPVRTKLDAQLTAGTRAAFVLPENLIASHPPPRAGLPYGVAFAFVIACAGHVERLESTDGYGEAPPFGCFNEQGQLQDKDQYVFSYARVFGYDFLRNENPTLTTLSVDGRAADSTGFTVTRCTETDDTKCAKTKLDAQVPEAAQEPDPSGGPPGSNAREQIWVSYFVTGGKMESDLSVLYDPQDGKLPKTENGLFAKQGAGGQTVYVVVRDNRGGVSWRQFPFTIQ